MTQEDVETQILTPMQLMFLPPRDLSKEERMVVMASYTMALKQFNESTLAGAWAEVLTAHRTRAWPVPGVIVAAALKVAKERRDDAHRAETPRDFAGERARYWDAVRTTPLARMAAKMGIAFPFKLAIVDGGKAASEVSLQALMDAKASAARMADRISRNQPLRSADGRSLGVMKPREREIALGMYDALQLQEAETEFEILGPSQPAIGENQHVEQTPTQSSKESPPDGGPIRASTDTVQHERPS